AIGRKTESIRHLYVVTDDLRRAVEIDEIKIAGLRFAAVGEYRARTERARIDPAFRIRRDVVVTDVVLFRIAGEQRDRLPAVERLERNVASADDEPSGYVQRHSANAAAMFEHGGDFAVTRYAVDTTPKHIGEEEPAFGIPHRSFD